MSGEGNRFRAAGYEQPKPLIVIDGKPAIEHVVSMFPGETRITFICNREHLESTNMRAVLTKIAPSAKIVQVEPHKLGPVFAVAQCLDCIEDSEEVIVNYCDFFAYFNYDHFLREVRERKAAGCVLSYRGFHPHMLGTDHYAFIRDRDQYLLEIREKQPFTSDRMSEFASTGTYYFQKGDYVKRYFTRLIERGIHTNGEYYVSMIYNLMVEDGLSVWIHEVQHMLQWGTPKDLEEYLNWSDYFRSCIDEAHRQPVGLLQNTVNLIPMAGHGLRFQHAAIKTPKPFILIAGKSMFLQASASLPPAERVIFVCLADQVERVRAEITACAPIYRDEVDVGVDVVSIQSPSRGQAETCMIGIAGADPPISDDDHLIIGACDNAMLYDSSKFLKLIETGVEAVAFTFRNHPSSNRNPQMYGWIATEYGTNRATGVSVKKAISADPRKDHAIVGAFYFRNVYLFRKAFEQMIKGDIRINDEYYVDSLFGILIENGHDCRVFEVDNYICWGTPDDWKTFCYWQSFFHKCQWHPYSLEKDPTCHFGDKPLLSTIDASFSVRPLVS